MLKKVAYLDLYNRISYLTSIPGLLEWDGEFQPWL